MPPELEVTMKEVAGQTALTRGDTVARTPSLMKDMSMIIRKRRMMRVLVLIVVIMIMIMIM